MMGSVTLVGAGPGDPGLLTVKGEQVLRRAEVVVYDRLVSPEVLQRIPPEAEKIDVGKESGCHPVPQARINEILREQAQAGKRVVRLKGGDPFLFGRGGEELAGLAEAGVPFEVVPGVTSALAVPAYAGIPLTHRNFSSSVTLITGHENPDKPGSVHNWKALAASANTLVFVMGMKNLPDISRNLIAAGLPADTPAALVHWGTTAKHRSLAATIGTLPEEAVRQGFTNPSVIIVGKVVSLRDRLNWFEHKPLLGRSVVVTRAREQASGLAARLAELGAEVIQFPTIDIKPLDDSAEVDAAVRELKGYDWLIFTSANGVKCFWDRLEAQGLDARALSGLQIAAIGPATAQAVRVHGIAPDFVPEAYIAESVAKGLIEKGMDGKKVLLPRAREAREVLPEELRKAGADGIIFGGYHPEASKLVQQLAKKKVKIPFIGPDGVKDEQFIKVAGKNAEGVYATGPTDVSKLPMNIQAHENHKKKYGSEPGAFYDNAYSATIALLEAIKAAGGTDSQKIMDALHNNLVDTPLGKIKFAATGDAEGIGFSIYQVKNGDFVELK